MKVSGGSTVDNSSIRLQFAENQILHLSNIIDGDIHNISASDGGFEIINAPDSKNFHLTLDQVASQTDNSERAVAIDFSSSQLVELNLSVVESNLVSLMNSGGQVQKLSVNGSGRTNLGIIPGSITTIDASLATADISFRVDGRGVTATTGSGADSLILNTSGNIIRTRDGGDYIQIFK